MNLSGASDPAFGAARDVRLLASAEPGRLAATLRSLAGKANVNPVLSQSVTYLRQLFAEPSSPGTLLLRGSSGPDDGVFLARATSTLVLAFLADMEPQ
jgi:hypothetical protein